VAALRRLHSAANWIFGAHCRPDSENLMPTTRIFGALKLGSLLICPLSVEGFYDRIQDQ
jgi:hypothetical protein